MSTDIFSEEEGDSPDVQRLLKENKMKELALKKATNLIELLNIELEVQRNTSQENLRILEQELKSQHHHQLQKLQQKVEDLQLELKRRSQTSIDYDRTIRKTVLTRANSAKSAENMRRRAMSKKYTETLPFEEMQQQSLPHVQVGLELYRQKSSEFQAWKGTIAAQLDQLVKSQYDELQVLISRIEDSSEECRDIGTHRSDTRRDMYCELTTIVRKQNTIINGLRGYAQELEDICKSVNFQLSSLMIKRTPQEDSLPINMEPTLTAIRQELQRDKERRRGQMKQVESENMELKSILEGLIKIVKSENRNK